MIKTEISMLTVPISAVPMFPVNFFQNFYVVSYFANLCQKPVLCDDHSGCRKIISLGFSHRRGLGQGSHVGPADGTRHGSPRGRSVRREVFFLDSGLTGMDTLDSSRFHIELEVTRKTQSSSSNHFFCGIQKKQLKMIRSVTCCRICVLMGNSTKMDPTDTGYHWMKKNPM